MPHYRLRHGLLLGLLGFSSFVSHAQADAVDAGCRIAFDVGSSGIRVGASNNPHSARHNIDYLSPLWAGRGLQEIITPTVQALRQLPVQAQLDTTCQRMAGGFSAWRLAWSQSATQTVAALEKIYADSGVALLVVPQTVEGSYGYRAAQQALGPRLQTSHILDVGGGSLQIAGAHHSYGKALGQKFGTGYCANNCAPKLRHLARSPPLNNTELAQARQLLQQHLQDLPVALPEPVSMTAISRPITQGVQQAVQRLQAMHQPSQADKNDNVLERSTLSAAIEQLAPASLAASAEQTGIPLPYAAYLLSDMLLTEGLLQASASQQLHLLELKVANVPGLLADQQAFAWAAQYPCYLQRLQAQGPNAYFSDPHSCTVAPTQPHQPVAAPVSPLVIPAGENPVF